MFYIDRKATESDEAVEFELSSPATCGIAHSDPANPQPVHLVPRGGYRTGKAAITPVAVTLTTRAIRWMTRAKIAAGC